MSENETIRWSRDEDGVVVLTLDDPARSANTMNRDFQDSLGRALDRLEAELDEVSGVVIASAKKTFMAGGDLNDLVRIGPDDGDAAEALVVTIKEQMRRLETLGRPVVAVVAGAALGGGLEVALAAHHRIVLDDPKVALGLPEVQLGLCPGAGGVVRTVRMLGVFEALMKLLLEGKPLRPGQALELGIADELVATEAELLPRAKSWIAANPEAAQPWDREGYRMPGGTPADPRLAANLAAYPASLRKQLHGANYPAPRAIMAAAVEGAQLDFDNALAVENRYFVHLATGQVATNMIQAFFFDMQQVKGDRLPAGAEAPPPVRSAAVLGAGMMGAAIAYVCAEAGVEVALIDVDAAAAERGKGYSERLLAKAVERGRTDQGHADEVLARITPAAEPKAAAGAELVIEAVFEDPAVKREVFERVEPHLAPDALLASNTSSLPITELAAAVSRPQDFIGLHFFSPAEKMPLLEIVKGEAGSEQTLARALALAKQLRKTPIVVNDSRGFFTSRVIATFIDEGIAMLADGVPAPSIEQASAQAGYPAPVLQLTDELNLGLLRKIREANRTAVEAAGGEWTEHPAENVVDRMLDQYERDGRLGGAGFYEYEDGKRAGLWPGLRDAFPPSAEPPSLTDLEERMLFIEALEAVKCVEEGVIESIADANIGSILGIGFPRWTGGVLQYINGYEDGLEGFVERARDLADLYGPRFLPPQSLIERAEAGETFADRSLSAA
jgi:3-hydroxyacyl-CoA dehydrogenase/enoyl-CoA hydratase/3-hydroxybutyryl-CoA epimerase